jgi:hypothetical protein
MLTVHVRVSDAATRQPTPVRLRLVDAAGVCHMPFGRLTEFATGPGEDVGGQVQLGGDAYAYIDGACEVRLPPGPIRVQVRKGPEYLPLDREVVLGPGKISLRLEIERWLDPHTQGWYSGDCRAHELSPHAARLEGAAEGLDVVNLLARQRPPHADRPAAFENLLAFSGTQPTLEGSSLVVVNTCNTHPVLGTLALLNSHRPVYPLRFGAPDGLDDWSILDWCDQCHRKKGLVVWPDEPRLTPEHPQGEALAALLLGKVDAFEICHLDHPQSRTLDDWYRLLACGQRLPLVGASGKDSNAVALGVVRTYARLEPGQEFSYGAWVEAIRAGRTFVTDGPFLSLTVDEHGPGSVLTVPDEGKMVRVRVEARSATPFARLELMHNGEVIADAGADSERPTATLERELRIDASGWLAARCRGDEKGSLIRAHTSPVYLRAEGRPLRPSASTIAPLLAVLDVTLAWVHRDARCANEPQREQLAQTLRTARQELLGRIKDESSL